MRRPPRFFPPARYPVAVLLVAALTLPASTLRAEPPSAEAFAAQWYRGAAEITSYALEQARYGEVHPGDAVLIFVTEPFSRSRQVKLDDPSGAGDDRVDVLKLNFTKTFDTGIYPYSMMTSAFTPVTAEEGRDPLKITTSSQEWCGHTFSQLNREREGYRVTEMSYFESEGDRVVRVDGATPEDGIWSRIRLDPESLPIGRVQMVPGTMFQRLRHQAWRAQWAEATLAEHPGHQGQRVYTLSYEALGRTLSIRFQADFPFEIEGWEERYRSGFGPGAQPLTTRAVRKERMMLDYWRRHNLEDAPLRKALGL